VVSHGPDDAERDGPRVAGGALADALGDLRERLRAAGEVASGDDPASHQWRLLRAGCSERRQLLEYREAEWLFPVASGAPAAKPQTRGGSEHQCRFLEAIGRWEKVTYPNQAGWWIDVEDRLTLTATPEQYLERLVLSNEVFGDDVQFLGLRVGPRSWDLRISTTQVHVRGESPPGSDIRDWLEARGFIEQFKMEVAAYRSLAFRRDDLWLLDVRPANFVRFEEQIFPIDIIVQHAR
jgi:hypothetical protein